MAEEHELEVVVGHYSTTSESESRSETEEESPSSSLKILHRIRLQTLETMTAFGHQV